MAGTRPEPARRPEPRAVTSAALPATRARRSPRGEVGHRLALLLVIAYLAAFFFLPLAVLVAQSVQNPSGTALSSDAYDQILATTTFHKIIFTTLRISFEATLVTIVLAYPLAAFLSTRSARLVAVLLVLVVIPYFTSTLVRTFAWMVILGQQGAVNSLLEATGLTQSPIQFLYNELGVLIGLVYVFLPFTVLVLYSVMRGIDRDLLRAAASSGAGPVRSFLRVYLPLSMPGVVAGGLLTFVMALGSYITPAVMGSPRETMIAMTIQQELNLLLDWRMGSALAVVLLGIVVAVLLVYDRAVGLSRLFEGMR